jgi:hypothetical protein
MRSGGNGAGWLKNKVMRAWWRAFVRLWAVGGEDALR